jgi:molybdopterin/thiamine biosynthesis adenylyltransferase
MKHSRYQRQVLLKEINDAGQTRIRNAKVLLVGMGGLNSPAALYLSAAGIGTIGIIDDDCVDISNLHRQIIFNEQDEGTHKVSAAKEKITKLNSEVEVIKYKERLTEKNVENLFSTFDVIVDGSDNFETKFLINDAAYKTGKTVIYGSVNQFEGQVAIFSPSDGPCYRCFHPEKPKAKIQNCAEAS